MKLKYEDYKKLKVADKEEYDYRFRDNNIKYSIGIDQVIILWAIQGMFFVTAYFLIKTEGFDVIKQDVTNIIQTTLSFTTVWISACILIFVIELIAYIIIDYKKNKWLKEKGIIKKPLWKKNDK